jgi:hypothetical protein
MLRWSVDSRFVGVKLRMMSGLESYQEKWSASFLWNLWCSCAEGFAQVSLKQTTDDVLFKKWPCAEVDPGGYDIVTDIRNYFALETKLAPLVEEWSAADAQCRQARPANQPLAACTPDHSASPR